MSEFELRSAVGVIELQAFSIDARKAGNSGKARRRMANLAERDLAKERASSATDLAFTHSALSCEASFFRNCAVEDSVICRVEDSTLFDPSWQPANQIESAV